MTKIQDILNKANIPAGSNATKDPDAARVFLAAPERCHCVRPQARRGVQGICNIPRLMFASSTSNHCDVPQTYWADMMKSF